MSIYRPERPNKRTRSIIEALDRSVEVGILASWSRSQSGYYGVELPDGRRWSLGTVSHAEAFCLGVIAGRRR